jgi:hypothetical protein
MPIDPKACVRISAFNWVPPFAQGYVRDLRVRWALEEAGIPYKETASRKGIAAAATYGDLRVADVCCRGRNDYQT